MAGICDEQQEVCLGLGLWNGQDPFLKERLFGLTNSQGNHGEDVKECWWYLDATPTSSWLQWRYHYPQARFPYEDLVAENARRGRNDPEYELVDTGIFDAGRYFVVTVTWAKHMPEDILWQIEVENVGPDPAPLDVLPTVWFRNRWSWDFGVARSSIVDWPRRALWPRGRCKTWPFIASVTDSGSSPGAGPDGRLPEPLFCDNDTNARKLWGSAGPDYPKDGISDHVVYGTETVNPALSGTKASLRYHLELAPGATARIRLRFAEEPGDLGEGFDAVLAKRKAEADEYFASISPVDITPDESRSCGRRQPGCFGASSTTTTTSNAGFTATRPNRHPLRKGWRGGTPAGRTFRTARSSRCRTRGSTLGTPRGTSLSTPWRWLTSTRSTPNHSSYFSVASGSCTPTASFPPTSGTSAT